MNKYALLFIAGNKAQLEKLEKHEDKTGWDDINILYAYYSIQKAIHGLSRAIESQNISILDARSEAADIANYAHMIILKCDALIKERDAAHP